MEITPDVLQTVIIGMIIIVASIIVVKSPMFTQNITKRHLKLSDSYVKDLEEEIDYLKKQVRAKNIKANVKERGPVLEDGEWGAIVPELVKNIAPFVPKKLQPLFADTEISGAIVKQVIENPDKYKDTIKSFIGKATGKSSSGNQQEDGITL